MSNIVDTLIGQIHAMPELMNTATVTVNEKRDALRKAELERDLLIAQAYATATGTVKDRENAAMITCKEILEKVNTLKSELDTAVAAYSYVDNQFTAVRKEASLVEGELRNLN